MKTLLITVFLIIGVIVSKETKAHTRANISSIVTVIVHRLDGGLSRATGFFVDERHIVTNYHVVYRRKNSAIILNIDGVMTYGLVVYEKPKSDLALIELNSHKRGRTPFNLCKEDTIKEGQRVRLISRSPGVKLDFMRIKEVTDYWTVLDQRPEPGDSGSPIVRGYGRDKCVIGVVTACQTLEDITIVINVQALRDFLK